MAALTGPRSPEVELVCGICQNDLMEIGELGEIDSCNHRFCHPCISRWAEIENSCPFCKQRFAQLRRKRLAPRSVLLAGGGRAATSELPGTYVDCQQVEERNQRVAFQDPSFQHWIEELACLACGGGDDEAELLLCDECDRACHTYCAGLEEIPEGEWFCPRCTERRARRRGQRQQAAAAQQQRRQARPRRQPRAAAAAARRRRRWIEDDDDEEAEEEEKLAVLSSSSIEDDSEKEGPVAAAAASARRPAQRRRRPTAGAAGVGRGGGGGRRRVAPADPDDNEDLAGFIVPDESEEVSLCSGPRPAVRRRRPQRTRPRQRHSPSGGSDQSAHDRFGHSEPEAESSDIGSSSEAEEVEEDERPLLARLQRRATHNQQGQQQQQGWQQARSSPPWRSASGQQERRRGGTSSAADALPTRAHRNVLELAASWEDLRTGNTTFAAVCRSTGRGGAAATPAAAAPVQPQRRRLLRAGAVAGAAGSGGGGAAAGRARGSVSLGSSGGAEVVDLLSSPSPLPLPSALRPTGTSTAATATAAASADEQLAWRVLEAAQDDGRQRQGQRRQLGSRQGRPSPFGAADDFFDSDLDVPLAVRISRQIGAARERGAQLAPRQQQPSQQQIAAGDAGPSVAARRLTPGTAHRTARDMRLMAAAARSTPGSSGGVRCSGGGAGGSASRPFVIPRMQALEGGSSGGTGSGFLWQQPAVQQQQGGALQNPFASFQLQPGGGAGAGSNAGGRPWLQHGSNSGGGGSSWFGYQQQQQQQQGRGYEAGSGGKRVFRNGGSPEPLYRRPLPLPAPPLAVPPPQQQQPLSPSPSWGGHGGDRWQQQEQCEPLPPPQQPQLGPRSNGGAAAVFATAPCLCTTTSHLQRQQAPGALASLTPATEMLATGGMASRSLHPGPEPLPPHSASWGMEGMGRQRQPAAAGAASGAPPSSPPRAGGAAAAGAAPSPSPQRQATWQLERAEPPLVLASLAAGPRGAVVAGSSPDTAGRHQHEQLLSKQQILDGIKPLLKRRLAEGLLNRNTYKLAAKAAVESLHNCKSCFSAAEAEQAVEDAVQQCSAARTGSTGI